LIPSTANSPLREISPQSIRANPNNPRRYFNEERLDLLRTSLQEVGVLVPLIVYEDPGAAGEYVLMDGERRWRCSMDLVLESVPANVIPAPSELDNLLRMFNIHNVREDWPLISVALSLRDVMRYSQEDGEKRLSEMTGLTRSTVRRAKRLLSIPDSELERIRDEAHLDRSQQVHREDLYLEIEAADSVIRSTLPEVGSEHSRPEIIRAFVAKAEHGSLRAVTEFRNVGKLLKTVTSGAVPREVVKRTIERLIEEIDFTPQEAFDAVAADGYRQQNLLRKSEVLISDIDEEMALATHLSPALIAKLSELADRIKVALEKAKP
jgi:ParB family chromosome partitioning protein